MTLAQRQAISSAHIATVKRMEAKFVTKIFKAIYAQVKEVTRALRSGGLTDATTVIDKMLVNEDLAQPIIELYKLFGAYSAYKTRAQINKSARQKTEIKAFGINEEWLKEIIRYLTERIFEKVIVPISKTNRDLILAKIMEGQEKGWGVDKIAFELEKPDFSLGRARLIVRTESQIAMNYGREVAKSKSRWETESVWIAANDHRTRDSHRKVDGDRVDEGKRFTVPIIKNGIQIGVDLMLGPGDPSASAGNVCNCRCTMVTVAKRDEKGRLIPKQNNYVPLNSISV